MKSLLSKIQKRTALFLILAVVVGLVVLAPGNLKMARAENENVKSTSGTGIAGFLWGALLGRGGQAPSAVVDSGAGAPMQVSGCGWSDILTGSFSATACIATGASYLIGYIGSWFIQIILWGINLALAMNSQLFSLPVVQLGWLFMRDVANMGFLVGMIIISFATIFRSQTYGVKQLLVKLIIAAVLVNFSLAIAGVFFDIAGIPTQFFLQKIGDANNSGQFADALASALQIQRINELNTNSSKANGLLHDLGSTAAPFASIFMAAIFTFIAVVTLGAFAFMLLVRFVYLSILLILMPMAVLAWVFPALRGRWSQWSQKFIQWVFFAPVVLFFTYLAIYTLVNQKQVLDTAVGALMANANPNAAVNVINGQLLFFANNPALQIGEMFVAVGLILGGLFAANALSITGASAAFNFAAAGARKIAMSPVVAGRYVGGMTANYAREQALTAGAGGGQAPAMQRAANSIANMASRLPLVGIPFRAAADKMAAAVKDVNKSKDEYVKRFQGQTQDYIAEQIKLIRQNTTSPAMAAALIEVGLKNGAVGKIKEEAGGDAQLDKAVKAAEGTGIGREAMKLDPTLAEKFGKTIGEAAQKAVPDAYRLNVKPKSFEGEKGEELALNTTITNYRVMLEDNLETFNAARGALERIDKEKLTKDDPNSAARLEKLIYYLDQGILSQGNKSPTKGGGAPPATPTAASGTFPPANP